MPTCHCSALRKSLRAPRAHEADQAEQQPEGEQRQAIQRGRGHRPRWRQDFLHRIVGVIGDEDIYAGLARICLSGRGARCVEPTRRWLGDRRLELVQLPGRLADLRHELISGLSVTIVALAMVLTIASGASPDKSLRTAIIAGLRLRR